MSSYSTSFVDLAQAALELCCVKEGETVTVLTQGDARQDYARTFMDAASRLGAISYNVTLPEKQVLGTYAAKIEELAHALQLMASGQVDALSWVQRFPLEEGVTAFRRMLAAKGNDIKAVICP